MRRLVFGIPALLAMAVPSAAQAQHELHGHMSAAGVEYLETAIPTALPEQLSFDNASRDLLECTDTRTISMTVNDTVVNLSINDLNIQMPENGVMRIDANVSASGDGELYLENPYACFGEATCTTDFSLQNTQVGFEFGIEIVDGRPVMDVRDVDLGLASDDLQVEFDGCTGIDTIANVVISGVKEFFFEEALSALGNYAQTSVGPIVNEMMVGFSAYEGSLAQTNFRAALAELNLYTDSMYMAGEFDLSAEGAPASCITKDTGEPETHKGSRPALDIGAAHMTMEANLGAVDDALYHVWRRGVMCLNEQILAARGVELHLEHEFEKILPGFPVGTEWGMDVRLAKPPRVVGRAGGGEGLTLVAEGIEIDISGHRPDGTSDVVHIELDASIAAGIEIDPAINGLYIKFGEANVNRLFIDDALETGRIGLDAGRLREAVNERILPHALEDLGKVPVTAPVMGMAGFYAMLRRLEVTDAFLGAQIDMFVAPKNDTGAPNTAIASQPEGVANPRTAAIVVNGNDDQIPSELLQYVVTVDGEARPASHLRAHRIGLVGETKTYSVQIAAVDLAGNVDPSPASTEITVDGISPDVAISGKRILEVEGDSHTLSWIATDDLTDASQLKARVDIYRLNDKKDTLSGQLVDSFETAAGATSATMQIEDGDLYRVELIVTDEAGNDTTTSALITTPDYGSGGCSAGGSGAGGFSIGLAIAALAFMRRRRS